MKSDIRESIIVDLREKYKKSVLSKKELASEFGISISTLNNYMVKNYGLPRYRRIGSAKNAKVIFAIADIAKFLADSDSSAVEIVGWE